MLAKYVVLCDEAMLLLSRLINIPGLVGTDWAVWDRAGEAVASKGFLLPHPASVPALCPLCAVLCTVLCTVYWPAIRWRHFSCITAALAGGNPHPYTRCSVDMLC